MDMLKKTEDPENGAHFTSLPGTTGPGDTVRVLSHPVVAEDEISLIDIWLVLARRKWVILAGVLLGAIAAAALALFTPDKYRFYSTISLGQMTPETSGGTKGQPLESPEAALAKLEEVFLPQVMEQAAAKSEAPQNYRLQAKIPKGSNLIKIEATGSLQDEQIYLQLINDATQTLVQDHDRMLAPARTRLSTQLERAKLELGTIEDDRIFAVKENSIKRKIANFRHNQSALKDQRIIIESRFKHIAVEDELTRKQRQGNDATLRTALKNRAAAIKQSDSTTTAITLLTLGNEIQRYQDRIAALDQRLNIDLPEKRGTLEKQLEDNARTQQQKAGLIGDYESELKKLHIDREKQGNLQMLTIREIESNIAAIEPTRILRQAGKSIGLVGTGTSVKVALGLILGLMIGVFGAFVVEFSAKARKTMG